MILSLNPKKKKIVKKIRKLLKKKLKKLDTESGDEYTKLKALQIADGEAQIYYLVDEEKLIIQIKEIINHSKHELLDFYAVVTLLKYGKVHRSLKGPKFQLNPESNISYNKEFVFGLLFDDILSSSVIIQIQGILNNKNIVASRVLIQLSNFDIIYSSVNKLNEHASKEVDIKQNIGNNEHTK